MKKIMLLIGLYLGGLALAAAQNASGEIARIYANDNNIYFKLKNDSCNPSSKYYFFSMADENAEAWYSLMLAAANTSKKIIVRVGSCPTTTNARVVYIYQDF